jgi:hypothetical protein
MGAVPGLGTLISKKLVPYIARYNSVSYVMGTMPARDEIVEQLAGNLGMKVVDTFVNTNTGNLINIYVVKFNQD